MGLTEFNSCNSPLVHSPPYLGDDGALDLVVGRGDALVRLEALERRGAALRLVGDHTAHGAPQHAAGRGVVEGPVAGLGAHAQALEEVVLRARAHHAAGDDDALRADHHDCTFGGEGRDV
jgi:hypothetical protein